MLPTNINLIAVTRIVARTPQGDATVTLTPGPIQTTCAVEINVGGQTLRKSQDFATKASGMEKVSTIGPLVQKAMKKIGATKATCTEGLPVEVSVLHDGQWVTLKRNLSLDQGALGQLTDLLKYIKRVNTKVESEA